MLLVEMTLPSGLRRISNEPLALEHYWEPVVASCGPVSMATDQPYGGYVRPQFGRLELLPSLFADDWPPPVSVPLTMAVTDTDEAGAVQLMAGTAHRAEIRRDGIAYDLYGREYGGRFTDHSYGNTVSGLFANNIASADPSLTADTGLADPDSAPYILYVDTGDQVVIDSLSRTCAVAAHLFYIQGTTAHLVDMFTDNGSMELTEFDFFPSSYTDQGPLATCRCGDTSLACSWPYGREVSVSPVFNTSDTAEITTGLERIRQILEAPLLTLKAPITATVPKFGQRVSWTDSSQWSPLSAWMRVRSIVWDFDRAQVVLRGEGGLA